MPQTLAAAAAHGQPEQRTVVVTALADVPPPGVLWSWDPAGRRRDSGSRMQERRDEDRRVLLRVLRHRASRRLRPPGRRGAGRNRLTRLCRLVAALGAHLESAERALAPAGIGNAGHKPVRDTTLASRPDATLDADVPVALYPGRGGFRLPAALGAARWLGNGDLLSRSLAVRTLAAARCYRSQLPRLLRSPAGS